MIKFLCVSSLSWYWCSINLAEHSIYCMFFKDCSWRESVVIYLVDKLNSPHISWDELLKGSCSSKHCINHYFHCKMYCIYCKWAVRMKQFMGVVFAYWNTCDLPIDHLCYSSLCILGIQNTEESMYTQKIKINS